MPWSKQILLERIILKPEVKLYTHAVIIPKSRQTVGLFTMVCILYIAIHIAHTEIKQMKSIIGVWRDENICKKVQKILWFWALPSIATPLSSHLTGLTLQRLMQINRISWKIVRSLRFDCMNLICSTFLRSRFSYLYNNTRYRITKRTKVLFYACVGLKSVEIIYPFSTWTTFVPQIHLYFVRKCRSKPCIYYRIFR